MKKIFASVVATLLLTLAASAPVFAQSAPPADPAATKAVKEMFVSMNYRAIMTSAMQQMSNNMGGAMRGAAEAAIKSNPKLSDAQRKQALAQLDARLPAMISAMQSFMNDPLLLDEILDATVPVYARAFSVDEIGQMAAFYRSPVGAKMLALTPQLMSEGMQVGQQVVARRLGPLMQQLQQGADK